MLELNQEIFNDYTIGKEVLPDRKFFLRKTSSDPSGTRKRKFPQNLCSGIYIESDTDDEDTSLDTDELSNMSMEGKIDFILERQAQKKNLKKQKLILDSVENKLILVYPNPEEYSSPYIIPAKICKKNIDDIFYLW